MARLPLNTLPAFQAAARRQNRRAVAGELNLTHSAVSQQIKLLEQQIGVTLFDRRGRSLVLNAAGQALQRAVQPALERLADGVEAARRAAGGEARHLRLTVLPSFAQRWLLPRMGRWHARHPDITLEVHASQLLVDLKREGFHAALRVGGGVWRGLEAERLMDSPLVAVGAPERAARIAWDDFAALATEPLLGDRDQWARFLALGGVRFAGRPVADFNDLGLMLQAAEQDLGIALAREVLAADALAAGRLVRLAGAALPEESRTLYWLAHPAELRDWPPLQALRQGLRDEMDASLRQLEANRVQR
ncbi:MAG: LysR family transcriptional regulator [Acidobacteria bacterium]|nr:LysR family transcriptional regulator [Acidobacteriota bacterium]